MTSTVVTFGETMALFANRFAGRIAQSGDLTIGIGGAESNFVIGLARLGTSVTWVGRVGNDSLGEQVLRELRAEGVTVQGVVDDAAPTGIMIKERRTEASTNVMYYRMESAGSRLRPRDVSEETIRNAIVLHITGITMALSSSARNTIDYAVRVAKEAGVTVSFDLNFRSKLWTRAEARSAFRTLLSRGLSRIGTVSHV